MNYKKIIISLSLLAILILAWSKVLDKKAYESNLETTKDVAVYLATTRGLNAVLTIVEEINFQVGIGVTVEISMGKIINPINDFLDRFSWILLLSLISLGLQKLILTFGEANLLNILLSISIFIVIFGEFYSKKNNDIFDFFRKIMLFIIFLRFAIPFMEISNSYIYQQIMQKQIKVIEKKMIEMKEELEVILPTSKNKDKIKNLNLEILKSEKIKTDILAKKDDSFLEYYKKIMIFLIFFVKLCYL